MTTYFSLPLDLRQKILSEAVAIADSEDALSLLAFEKVLYGEHLDDIIKLGQVPLTTGERDRVLPLHCTPTVATLIDRLVTAHGDIRADLAFVVNKWYAPSYCSAKVSTFNYVCRADNKKATVNPT